MSYQSGNQFAKRRTILETNVLRPAEVSVGEVTLHKIPLDQGIIFFPHPTLRRKLCVRDLLPDEGSSSLWANANREGSEWGWRRQTGYDTLAE